MSLTRHGISSTRPPGPTRRHSSPALRWCVHLLAQMGHGRFLEWWPTRLELHLTGSLGGMRGGSTQAGSCSSGGNVAIGPKESAASKVLPWPRKVYTDPRTQAPSRPRTRNGPVTRSGGPTTRARRIYNSFMDSSAAPTIRFLNLVFRTFKSTLMSRSHPTQSFYLLSPERLLGDKEM